MQKTLKSRTIFCCDNLEVLRGINSESIDLVYLDPPFNKKKVFTAPIGSSSEGTGFSDIFREKDVKDEWLQTIKEDQYKLSELLQAVKTIEGKSSYNFCYLCYMAIRLIELHRVLKDTGSLYLHCDQTMSHYLKIVLDCIFGEKNFRNEIVWKRSHPHSDSKRFGNNTDCVFFYSKNKNNFFQTIRKPLGQDYVEKMYRHVDEETGKRFRSTPLDAHSLEGGGYNYTWNDIHKLWRVPKKTMQDLHNKKQLYYSRSGLASRKFFLEGNEGIALQNLWDDIPHVRGKEKTNYPTQKPLALLERIIKASSNKGDIVLDPFCGCATTCVAAERLERRWIGIDINHEAYTLVNKRIEKEVPHDLFRGEASYTTQAPKRTDLGINYEDKKIGFDTEISYRRDCNYVQSFGSDSSALCFPALSGKTSSKNRQKNHDTVGLGGCQPV